MNPKACTAINAGQHACRHICNMEPRAANVWRNTAKEPADTLVASRRASSSSTPQNLAHERKGAEIGKAKVRTLSWRRVHELRRHRGNSEEATWTQSTRRPACRAAKAQVRQTWCRAPAKCRMKPTSGKKSMSSATTAMVSGNVSNATMLQGGRRAAGSGLQWYLPAPQSPTPSGLRRNRKTTTGAGGAAATCPGSFSEARTLGRKGAAAAGALRRRFGRRRSWAAESPQTMEL